MSKCVRRLAPPPGWLPVFSGCTVNVPQCAPVWLVPSAPVPQVFSCMFTTVPLNLVLNSAHTDLLGPGMGAATYRIGREIAHESSPIKFLFALAVHRYSKILTPPQMHGNYSTSHPPPTTLLIQHKYVTIFTLRGHKEEKWSLAKSSEIKPRLLHWPIQIWP